MQNYTNDNTARRYIANVTTLSTTQIHLRNPYIIAWWSAAFPGFGHLLLSKNIRGIILLLWEIIINVSTNLNVAIMYMFQGNFEASIDVLDTRWILVYMPVYIFGIWDSYRSTVDLNKIYILAEQEEHRFNTFSIGTVEINYLDKRNPLMASICSLFVPGLGQLYVHRIFMAFFIISWSTFFLYFSHMLEAIILLFSVGLMQATAVLEPEWMLFLPSIYFFAIYDAYMKAVESNKLFESEQKNFLKENYQNPDFQIIKGQKVQ